MDTVTIRAGVNNVLDNGPQLTLSTGTTGNGNTFPQLYDSWAVTSSSVSPPTSKA